MSVVTSAQGGLFGASVDCTNVQNLPCVVDPRGQVEVYGPGSTYQPLLIAPSRDNLSVGPGALDVDEEKFLRDLVLFCHPGRDWPTNPGEPLKWGARDIWFKRNLPNDADSLRLRISGSNWFYPDFVIWIMDYETKTQTYGFVDPKGLRTGAQEGWRHHRIACTYYVPHLIEERTNLSRIIFKGEEWTFRVRGVLISTSPLTALQGSAKFEINTFADNQIRSVAPNEKDFEQARIVVQKPRQEGDDYIEKTLRLLTSDNDLDAGLSRLIRARHSPTAFVPTDERDYDVLLRWREGRNMSEAEVAAYFLRDHIRGLSVAQERRRGMLIQVPDAKGFLGFGGEKAERIRRHPTPCQEYWNRTQTGSGAASEDRVVSIGGSARDVRT